ncbi:MAG: AAA family ATPase, partial [Eubacteriales bacterium]|nr:AAA family ATPase [Eubacteriales bacterium]
MHIVECYVENFGKLHKYRYNADCGLNVMCEGNGGGKTTLAAFIRAMFYGMPATRTRKTLDEAERKKYKPWQAGLWGGYLSFEKDKKQYRIERTFSDRDSQDTFRLLDMETGLICGDYSRNIGEEIFGIDRAGFCSSIYITSSDLKLSLNDSLSARIGGCTVDADDINNYDRAVTILNNQYKRYGKNGKPHVQQELEQLRADYEQKKAQYEALKLVTLPPEQETYPQWKLTAEQMGRLEWLDDFFGAGVPAKEQLKKYEDILTECRKHIKTDSLNKQYNNWLIPVLSALMVFVSAAFALYNIFHIQLAASQAVSFLMAGLVFYIINSCLGRRKDAGKDRGQAQKRSEMLGQVECFLDSFGLKNAYAYNNEADRVEQCVSKLGYLDKLRMEYEYLSEKELDYRQAVKQLRQKEAQHEQDIYFRERQELSEKLHGLEIRLHELEGDYDEAKRQMQINEKTRMMLEKSRNELLAGYLHGVRQYFAKYMNMFDSQLAARLSFDVDFNASVEENGILRELDYYSQGYKDIVRLCQRLAITEALFQKEKPFIILDDPFVNL